MTIIKPLPKLKPLHIGNDADVYDAESVKAREQAILQRLYKILGNTNFIQTDNEIKQLIQELEKEQ